MPTPQSEYAKKRTRELNRIACAKYRAAHPERVRASTYKWRESNYGKFQAYNRSSILKRKYGLTSVQWDELLTSQGGRCLICKTDKPTGKKPWDTDHCHTTGRVRGILCHHCNVLLGHAKEDVDTLRSAIEYLENHSS